MATNSHSPATTGQWPQPGTPPDPGGTNDTAYNTHGHWKRRLGLGIDIGGVKSTYQERKDILLKRMRRKWPRLELSKQSVDDKLKVKEWIKADVIDFFDT